MGSAGFRLPESLRVVLVLTAKRLNKSSRGRKPTVQNASCAHNPEGVEYLFSCAAPSGPIGFWGLLSVGFTHGYYCLSPSGTMYYELYRQPSGIGV